MPPSTWSNWINPVLLQIGPIAIHWYGLMYVLTFIFGYLILKYSPLGKNLPLADDQKDNLLISIILGIILGGRLGYIFFYNLPYYLQNPHKTLALWEGGLSFHGGLIGSVLAIILYLHFHKKAHHKKHGEKKQLSFWQIGDVAAFITPIGILLGRIGNFINAELYGRISPNQNLCLNFPTDPLNCRYPSQLFEAFGEGMVIFTILLILAHHTKILQTPGRLSSLFLILYGLIRSFIEYTREPDSQIGYLLGGPGFMQGLTLGQILSLLTSLLGVVLLLKFRKKA